MNCNTCKTTRLCDELGRMGKVPKHENCRCYTAAKPLTNYDRLISKSPEEMAEMMAVLGGCPLNVMTNCPKGHAPNEDCNAKRCWFDWLMQEVEE